MKLKTVPVIYLDDIDDARAAALNVVLNNRAAQGDGDEEKLAALLPGLSDGFDATLTGFDERQLDVELTATSGARFRRRSRPRRRVSDITRLSSHV